MKNKEEQRLKEIIKIAYELNWIKLNPNGCYPLMQLSEVEKCMIAMVSQFELNRMKDWEKEKEITIIGER